MLATCRASCVCLVSHIALTASWAKDQTCAPLICEKSAFEISAGGNHFPRASRPTNQRTSFGETHHGSAPTYEWRGSCLTCLLCSRYIHCCTSGKQAWMCAKKACLLLYMRKSRTCALLNLRYIRCLRALTNYKHIWRKFTKVQAQLLYMRKPRTRAMLQGACVQRSLPLAFGVKLRPYDQHTATLQSCKMHGRGHY